MTGNTDLIKSVSSEIVRFFSRGFVAGGDVLHFACSALDVTACEEIAAILADGDREQSGLSELVFHPPAEFRSGIEEFLPPEGVRPEIENKILVACECGIGVTRISFACCGLAAECPVTRDMLRAFTSALHLGNPVRCDIPMLPNYADTPYAVAGAVLAAKMPVSVECGTGMAVAPPGRAAACRSAR